MTIWYHRLGKSGGYGLLISRWELRSRKRGALEKSEMKVYMWYVGVLYFGMDRYNVDSQGQRSIPRNYDCEASATALLAANAYIDNRYATGLRPWSAKRCFS